MTLIYSLCLVVFVLVVLLLLAIKIIAFFCKKNKKLEEKVRNQQNVVKSLLKHTMELCEIKKDNNELLRRIQNAQNDDDINSVIADIVNRNNSRVQNSTNAENGASAEAEQGKTRSAKKP